MRPLVLPAVLLPLILAAPLAPARDETLKGLAAEFPALVAKPGDPGDREHMVRRVGTYDDGDGAKVLMQGLEALCARLDVDMEAYEKLTEKYREVNVPVDVMRDNYKTRTALQKQMMESEARQREDGIVLDAFRAVVAKYGDTKALSAVSSDARKAKSWRTKEVAAEALGRNPGGAESAIRLGKEPDARVSAAALRGLRGRKEDLVFAFACDCLKSEAWPVRREAIAVLEGINATKILRPLIEALAREDGRLRDDIRDALRRLTSQNFDSDPEDWKRWYTENRAELEGPAPTTSLFGAFKAKGPAPEKKSVYGIESRSRRILFIIDTSGSMKEKIAQAKGTITGPDADSDELNMTKIEIAKKHLRNSIRMLEPEASFNIVAFGTHVIRWKETMVKGDMQTKNEAYAFVRDMEAAGGTWAYGALQEAFRMAGQGILDKHYDPVVDTVYFISDGAPTNNDMDKPEFQDPEEILAAVREWNRIGKMIIHAVAIDPKAGGGTFIGFMKKLAAENGGQYAQKD